jgi:hypothetical protein
VLLLSKEAVEKEWPMRELRILMHRHKNRTVKLVPLLHFEEFSEFERCAERCSVDLWKEDLRQLLTVTMIKKKNVRCVMHGFMSCMSNRCARQPQKPLPELVQEVVDNVMRHMAALGCVHVDFPRPLAIGFDQQVQDLMAVVRGGKWLWLHGTGKCRRSGPHCCSIEIDSPTLSQGASARARSRRR